MSDMRYYLLFAALALSLAACTNDNEVMDNGPVAAVINAEISEPARTMKALPSPMAARKAGSR